MRSRYEDFLQRHPAHVRARTAFGSFLNDLGEEDEARKQWEKGLQQEPANPALWTHLGNYHAHRGPIEKAFEHYEKALSLNPSQPLYHQNLAGVLYLFRAQACAHYKIDAPALRQRVLSLYARAMELDPANFPLAADLAQTYYGYKPEPSGGAQAFRAHHE